MIDLIAGKLYLCKDGIIRKLNKITDKFLSYSYYCGKDIGFMDLGQTYRKQCEKDFTEGKIINESELE